MDGCSRGSLPVAHDQLGSCDFLVGQGRLESRTVKAPANPNITFKNMENCGGAAGSQRHRGGVHAITSYTFQKILRMPVSFLPWFGFDVVSSSLPGCSSLRGTVVVFSWSEVGGESTTFSVSVMILIATPRKCLVQSSYIADKAENKGASITRY